MYNRTECIGRLGSTAEMNYTPQGTAVCNFSVASDSGWGDNKKTVWMRVALWGKLAESLVEYLTKGKQVFVAGELNPDPETGGPRTWTDSEGAVRSSYEMTAREIRLLGGRSEPKEEEDENIPF